MDRYAQRRANALRWVMSKVSEEHKECGLSPVNKGKQSSLQFRFRVEKSYTDSLVLFH